MSLQDLWGELGFRVADCLHGMGRMPNMCRLMIANEVCCARKRDQPIGLLTAGLEHGAQLLTLYPKA